MLLKLLSFFLSVMIVSATGISASTVSAEPAAGHSLGRIQSIQNRSGGILDIESLVLFFFGLGAIGVARFLRGMNEIKRMSDHQEIELPEHPEEVTHGKLETANSL